MIYTENWTYEDNKLYRKLIKENKSVKDIISIMSRDKLKHKPNGYWSYGGVLKDFSQFVNEIKYTEKNTIFDIRPRKSKVFDEYDYFFYFESDSGEEYIFEFDYLKDDKSPFPNNVIYNLSFTTKSQKFASDLIEEDKEKTEIYENPTRKNEQHEIIKRLIFIFKYFHKFYGSKHNAIYVIGDTINYQKIEYYRKLINDSFDNVEEIEGESSVNLGKNSYYYKIKD